MKNDPTCGAYAILLGLADALDQTKSTAANNLVDEYGKPSRSFPNEYASAFKKIVHHGRVFGA